MALHEFVGAHGPAKRVFYATSIPTVGTYQVGDVCWNTAPAAGGAAFWVCTTAGGTGTFVFKEVNCAG
jgi:hypothetical protein